MSKFLNAQALDSEAPFLFANKESNRHEQSKGSDRSEKVETLSDAKKGCYDWIIREGVDLL